LNRRPPHTPGVYKRTPAAPPPWSKDGRAVPAWSRRAHPADRGFVVLVGTEQLADVIRSAGHEVVQAPHRGAGGTPVPGVDFPAPQVYWTTVAGVDEAEVLTILNRCMLISYTAALAMHRGLRELSDWPDVVAELRTCYRLGSPNDTLRSIIATLNPPQENPKP
jgi:hypothetical protein